MTYVTKDLTALGTRPAFNRTLRHLVSVTNIIEEVGRGKNLADLLNQMLESGTINRDQLAPILSVALVGKYEYPYVSRNVAETVSDFAAIQEKFSAWNAVNMVVAYYSPNLGIVLVNPANASHWETVHDLKKDELIVVHAKVRGAGDDIARKSIDAFLTLLAGGTAQEDPAFISKTAPAGPKLTPGAALKPGAALTPGAPLTPAPAAQAPAPGAPPAPAAATASAKASPPPKGKNLTPKYSVQVTNELFHNGNVEAWKNIIESYEEKHEGLRVIVYHEGELIQDLNSLFKWGKVKHGGLIFFQVAGNQIKNVSKLQKYLHVGASSRFETFMKHDVNRTLSLF